MPFRPAVTSLLGFGMVTTLSALHPSPAQAHCLGVYANNLLFGGTELEFDAAGNLFVRGGRVYIADLNCHTVRTFDVVGFPLPTARRTWGQAKTYYR